MQHKRLESLTSGEEVNARSEKGYEKLREELVGKVEQVRLHNNRIEELVQQLKELNQRLTAQEGQLLRLATDAKVNREEFLKHYHGAELIRTGWTASAGCPAGGWKVFVNTAGRHQQRRQWHILGVATDAGLSISEFAAQYTIRLKGRGDSARAKKEMIEATFRVGFILIAKKYTNRGLQFLT